MYVHIFVCSDGCSSAMDSSLLSNIQKLFYERIEVFATVEFYKLSIVTGIIKIVLKVWPRLMYIHVHVFK